MAESNAQSYEYPIPPATFAFLVESLLMQAQMHLGLLNFGGKDPENEDEQPNLPLAKHSIDVLGMLQTKTRGNLSIEEQRLLENGLTELRFRFVQVSDEQSKREKQNESRIIQPPTPEVKVEDDRPLIITPDGGKGSKT